MSKIDIPSWPQFEADEIEAVTRVLQSGRVNAWTGPDVGAFEEAWKQTSNCGHAMAMANGTLTIESAIRALQFDEKTEVIVPARTYVASASSIVMAGATPVFADVDLVTGCVTAETLEAVRGNRTRAAIVVHVGGWPADMTSIMSWAVEHDIVVIEDAAQAHGATTRDADGNQRWVGTFGDFGSWSFCQDKIMSTGGEGGLLAVRDARHADRVWSLRDHGKSKHRVESHAGNNRFAWWVDTIGSNLRMTCMQAAIGSLQLAKLNGWLDIRARNASILRENLQSVEWLALPQVAPHEHPSWYRFYVQVLGDPSVVESRRNAIVDAASEAGLPIGIGSCPEIYLEDGLQQWAPLQRLTNARDLGERCLCLPCHHLISDEMMSTYADRLVAICESID